MLFLSEYGIFMTIQSFCYRNRNYAIEWMCKCAQNNQKRLFLMQLKRVTSGNEIYFVIFEKKKKKNVQRKPQKSNGKSNFVHAGHTMN